MNIGIDFDNTIVCYDQIFYGESVARGLVPADIEPRKEAIRNYLRDNAKEDLWTELQGYVYGPGLKGAKPFPGILDFFHNCLRAGINTHIISHKTKFPYTGAQYDLHASAQQWLLDKKFY